MKQRLNEMDATIETAKTILLPRYSEHHTGLSIDFKGDYKLYNYLSSNVMANLLGMGTLSTISGLKAFGYIYNMKKKVSREMLTLVIVNSAGLSLFPSSLIMLRKDMGSMNLYEFYPYMIFISIFVLVAGLIIQRIIDHE